MSALRLYLLGALDIRYDDQPLDKPPTAKSQSLLAYLILHREHPQPRERLANLFWGERPERKARSSLSTSLWHIRRCLPDQALILSNPHAVQFDPHADLWLDTQAFESDASRGDIASLQSAAALYRGDFLDGFYDDWIVNERYRLEGLFAETLARLMVEQEAGGEHSAALSIAMQLLGRDPLREDAHRLAMRALCRLGQRNAALEQYRRCHEVLQQELGTEPMAETADLHQAILEGRFEVGRVAEVLPVETPVIPTGRSPLDVIVPSALAGREQEMAFLHGCWQKVEAGQGGLALINGETGVGKTRLVKEFADQLRWRGARVLWGRCYELERALPYQPIAEAVRTILPVLTSTELADLPTWVIAEVARLVPEIAERYPDLAAPVPIQPKQEQARLFNGVTRFLTELAAYGSFLIVLEDLHWASESTLQLIHYLVRHLADRQGLMVGTLRPEEMGPEHSLIALQQQLKREGLCRPLHLDRLSSATVVAMVQEMSGAGEAALPLAHRLCRETEGNPFFLMEIIKALFETEVVRLEEGAWQGDFAQISAKALPLPVGVSEAIQGRVHRLDEETQEALRLAAVLGHEFDFDLLDTAWGRGTEETLGALDDLLRHRLIGEGTGTLDKDYAFTHHKIQEVVYVDIPRRRRQHVHARVGAAMEQLYEPQLVMSELAFHFEHAQRADKRLTEKAVTYLRGVGEQAAAQYANADAVRYLSRALELALKGDPAARFDILLGREKVYDLQGDRESQIKDLEFLQELVNHLTVEQQAQMALRQASCAEAISDYPVAIIAAEEAVRLGRMAQAVRLEAQAQQHWGVVLWSQGNFDAARLHLETALELAHKTSLRDVEAMCLRDLGEIFWRRGDFMESEDYFWQTLHICQEIGDRLGESASLLGLGKAVRDKGDFDSALLHMEQSLHICREIGNRRDESSTLLSLGVLHDLQADYDSAKTYYEQTLNICREIDDRRGEASVLNNLGVVSRCQGAYTAAREYFEQALLIVREVGDRWGELRRLANLGTVSFCVGEYDQARGFYEQALQSSRELGDRSSESVLLGNLSQLFCQLGDNATAQYYGQHALDIAQELGRVGQADVLVQLGQAQMGLGHLAEADTAFRRAVDLFRELGERNLVTEPLAGLACVSLANGNQEQAKACVEEILAHLKTGSLDGTGEPFRVYLTCYRVLQANGDPRARDMLVTVHGELLEWAERITDQEMRRSFLENVAAHREIVAAMANKDD